MAEVDMNLYACSEEDVARVYRYDIPQLIGLTEEPEKVKTIPHAVKAKVLQQLGAAEKHGESFPVLQPTMPPIQEDEVAEVAGGDNDDNDPEEADLEPDQDDSA